MRQRTVDTFLRPALEAAQRDGVLAMLSSHHPTSSMDRISGDFGGSVVADAVEPAALDRLVAQYPLIGWMVGHDHDLRVRATRGADMMHPGFWEIMSGSVADHPAQARAMELINDGNDPALFGTLVDIQPRTCWERRYLRLTQMEYLSSWESNHLGMANDRNVELVIPVPRGPRRRGPRGGDGPHAHRERDHPAGYALSGLALGVAAIGPALDGLTVHVEQARGGALVVVARGEGLGHEGVFHSLQPVARERELQHAAREVAQGVVGGGHLPFGEDGHRGGVELVEL